MSVQSAVAFLNNTTSSSAPNVTGELTTNTPVGNGVVNSGIDFGKQKPPSVNTAPPRPRRPPSLASSRSSSRSVRSPTAHRLAFGKQGQMPIIPPNRRSSSALSNISGEVTDMFQQLLDKEAAAKERIEQLEKDVERYALDSTKVRDYEIRVQYLAQKLEQVTEERDCFEQELTALQHSNDLTPASQQQHYNDEVHADQGLEIDAKFLDGFLEAYENCDRVTENNETCVGKQHKQEVQFLTEQLSEYDKGVKIMMEKYVSDLEQERLENRVLQNVVQKQDELITKLESTPLESNDALLREQVELQRIELDSKRELLQQLLNEREELLKRSELYSALSVASGRHHSVRSSIDMLAEIARSDYYPQRKHTSSSSTQSPADLSSLRSSLNGRGTPPLNAPPRDPLPPLPSSPCVPSSKISERSSSLSSSRTASSTTSWSSSDCERHASFIRRTNDMKGIVESPLPHEIVEDVPTTEFQTPLKKQGSFWKGWKKKLDTR